MRQEQEKLFEIEHLEKADKPAENCFISSAVKIMQKDKSLKIALDSRKRNEVCVKRQTAMPNMEELISKNSEDITENEGELWMSKIYLYYAYEQAKLSKEAAKRCVFSIIRGDFTGHYRIEEGFYGLSDIPTVFQKQIDKMLEFKTPVCPDYIISVTNGTTEDHEPDVTEVLSKLQNAGYRASEKKTEVFKRELSN